MLTPKHILPEYSVDAICHVFQNKSGWSICRDGLWNADWTKNVLEFEMSDQSGLFQHEQDWVYIDNSCAEEFDAPVTLQALLDKGTKAEFRGHTFYPVYINWVIQYLRNEGELPEGPILITQR